VLDGSFDEGDAVDGATLLVASSGEPLPCVLVAPSLGVPVVLSPLGVPVVLSPLGVLVALSPLGVLVAPSLLGVLVAPSLLGVLVAPSLLGVLVAPSPSDELVLPAPPAGVDVAEPLDALLLLAAELLDESPWPAGDLDECVLVGEALAELLDEVGVAVLGNDDSR